MPYIRSHLYKLAHFRKMTTRKIKSSLRQATAQHTVLPFLFDFLSVFFVTSAVYLFLLSYVSPGFFYIFSVLSSLFPASHYYPSPISFSSFFTCLFPVIPLPHIYAFSPICSTESSKSPARLRGAEGMLICVQMPCRHAATLSEHFPDKSETPPFYPYPALLL